MNGTALLILWIAGGSACASGTRLPTAASPSNGSLLQTLAQARSLAEQNRPETAWETFAAVRSSLLPFPNAASSSTNASLDPALLGLGKAFLQRDFLEQAVDVWQIAGRRGVREAVPLISGALKLKGWPYWMDVSTVPFLPFTRAAVQDPLSPSTLFLTSPVNAQPTESEPQGHINYPFSLSAYRASLTGVKAGNGEANWLYQRFVVHYHREEDAELAKKLATDFSVIDALMEAKLGRRSRFDPNGRTQVWLVSDGDAGGEQWKQHLYFYNLSRSRSNLEWMREAAHEYGHACLPGTSGFTEPEGWADGELGERLLLRWLAREPRFRSGPQALTTDSGGGEASDDGLESLGFKRSGLEFYLSRYVQPLVDRFAETGWQPKRAAQRDRAAMEHVMGLALWAEDAHGTPFLRRLFSRVPHSGPTGLWAGYVQAIRESWKKGAGGLSVFPVGGKTRFYLPDAGSYRLQGSSAQASLPVTLPNGKSTSVKVGGAWKASPGWYILPSGPPRTRIERVALP